MTERRVYLEDLFLLLTFFVEQKTFTLNNLRYPSLCQEQIQLEDALRGMTPVKKPPKVKC